VIAPPTAAALSEASERALDWVVAHRDAFSPGGATDAPRTKPLVELALAVRSHRELAGPTQAVVSLEEIIRGVQHGRSHRERRRRTRNDVVVDLFLYAVLRHAGDDDPEARELAQQALDGGVLAHAERPPHRVMEEVLAAEWAGLSHDLPGWADLVGASLLGRPPNPAHLGVEATYELTHVIMFLFGFGMRARPPAPLPEPSAYRQLLATLLVVNCRTGHWDLVGELLLCWSCLGLEPGAVPAAAWRSLLAEQGPDGSFPAVAAPGGEEDGTDPVRRFGRRYHTTLVTILACDAEVRRWRERRTPPPAAPAAPVAVRPLADAAVLDAVAARELAWLGGLAGRDGSAEDLCQIAVGAWLCGVLAVGQAPAADAVAARVASRLHGGDGWDMVPAALRLVAAGVLGASAPAPPPLAGYAERAAALVRRLPADDLLLAEKRSLLHRLGLVAAPARPSLDIAAGPFGRLSLRCEPAELGGLLVVVEAATGYGTAPAGLRAPDAWVPGLLIGHAVERLVANDLVAACRLLRAAAYLDPCGEGLLGALSFLLLQQRPGGGFGFFGATAGIDDGVEADRRLNLPVSVNVLWTLAEIATGWRLHAGLPAPAHQ
jgi:hypothetical protein